MSDEIIGVEVQGCIIVCHCTTKPVLIIAGQRTIDVITGILRLKVDGLGQEALTLLPFLTRQTDHGPLCPDTGIVRIQFQTLIQRLDSLRRIFLQQIDLRLHRIAPCIVRPAGQHCINLSQSTLIVFLVDAAENTVMPKTLIVGIITDGTGIVVDRLRVFLLVDATETTQLIDRHHIRIAIDGFCAVTLRPTEIVEIELGHPPEEPRLIEIGFG